MSFPSKKLKKKLQKKNEYFSGSPRGGSPRQGSPVPRQGSPVPRQGSPVPMGVGTRQSFSPARSNSIPGASESSSQTSLTFVTPPSSPLATRKGKLTLSLLAVTFVVC